MIQPSGFKASCDFISADDRRCPEQLHAVYFIALLDRMTQAGWQYSVKRDGTSAKINGKDYCAKHRRS